MTRKQRIHAELARYGLTADPKSGVLEHVYIATGAIGDAFYIAVVSGYWYHDGPNRWRCHVRAVDAEHGDREVGMGKHADSIRAIRAAMALAGLEVQA
jgi:hypothetical protein